MFLLDSQQLADAQPLFSEIGRLVTLPVEVIRLPLKFFVRRLMSRTIPASVCLAIGPGLHLCS